MNPKFLIQPSETLPVELTETDEHLFYLNNHFYTFLLLFSFKISLSSEIKFVASHPSLIPNTQLLPYLASHLSQPCRHRCCCSASSSQPPLPLLCFFFTTQLSLLVLILYRYGFFFFFVATAGASSSFVQYRFDDSYFFLYKGLMILFFFFFFFCITGITIHICLMSLGSKFLYVGLMSLDLNLG